MFRNTVSRWCTPKGAQDLHRTTPDGDVLLHPLARLKLGAMHVTRTGRVMGPLSRWAALYFIGHVYYSRKTLMEGGVFSKSKMVWFQQDARLMDWYFHMIDKRPGFKIAFQHQMVLPEGTDADADDLLTEFARAYMLAWPRQWERRTRGLDEQLDRFTDEEAQACLFRPPTGFEHDASSTTEAAPANANAGWFSSMFGSSSSSKSETAQPTSEDVFPGDCIGGYFVHRRAGMEIKDKRRQLGGSSADEIGGRSIVIAPDPWEGQGVVLSASSGHGYATLRLSYACSPDSDWFPQEGFMGLLHRQLLITRMRYITISAGNQVDNVFRARAPPKRRGRHVVE